MRTKTKHKVVLGLVLSLFLGCQYDVEPKDEYQKLRHYQDGEELPVGAFSVAYANNDAFGIALPGLTQSENINFVLGDRLFNTTWVPSPASTTGLDGLGPTFNAKSCSSCHFKDGRGVPLKGTTLKKSGFLMRVSLQGADENQGPLPVPGYGNQIQNNGVLRVPGEAQVRVDFERIAGKYPDGTAYELRKPIYSFFDEQFGSLSGVLTSPRVGPQTIGLGFIDALSEQELLKNEDINDADNDGISGKANYVWDVKSKKQIIGRYGWKANTSTLEQQVAGAFHGDMGLSTSLFPKQNCPSPQQDCYESPNGDSNSFEVPDNKLAEIVFYQSTLSVPMRRNVKNENVLKGKVLFHKLKCVSCHQIGFKLKQSDLVPIMKNITINPYSDFLLHDMGDDLADGRPDFKANGNEWRTQPLWGIGLIKTVNKHTFLLHDGRARNVEEAILWHGGEAKQSKKDFMNLEKADRENVLKFINSL